MENFLKKIERIANDKKISSSLFLLNKLNIEKKKHLKDNPHHENFVNTITSEISLMPLNELREKLIQKSNDHRKELVQKEEKIIDMSASKIRNGSVVFVHGDSTKVTSILKKAKSNGTRFKVFTYSAPDLSKKFERSGIAAKNFSGLLLPNALEKSDVLFFEPELATRNKKIISSKGTNYLLEEARKKDVSTYCIINTLDVVAKAEHKREEINNENITAVINENGIMRTSKFFDMF